MKFEKVNIISCNELANGFVHMRLEAPWHQEALPGHKILLAEKFPCYLLGHQSGLEIIISPEIREKIPPRELTISPLYGNSLPPPNPDQFTLIKANEDELSALLFYFKKYRLSFKGFALIGTQNEFPFHPCPSRQMIPGIPNDIIAALPLLEDWGIPHRLASLSEKPGVFQGTVETLSELWLKNYSGACVKKLSI